MGRAERAETERRYLKSELVHWGVPVPQIRAVVRRHAVGLDGSGTMDLAEALWGEPVHERRMAAALLLVRNADLLTSGDLPQLETWIRQSRTWALVDTLVPRPVGGIADREPAEAGAALDRWAVDDDFWLRRAVLLAHLVALREGRGDWERFTRYADAMLHDREFFVRKAIGWVLRDTSRKRPGLVADWVAPRAGRMSGITVREAVKRLPAEQREAVLAAYRDGRPADQAVASAGSAGTG